MPTDSAVPFNENVAVAVPPEPESAAVPRVAPFAAEAAANETVPVGEVVPVDAFTVTLSVADALCVMPAGFALRVMVVGIRGEVTVTVIAGETDGEKFATPA